jgi:predicted transcriptional regulator
MTGAAVPTDPKPWRVTIRISDDMRDRLDDIAEAGGPTVTELARRGLDLAMAEHTARLAGGRR